MLCATALVVFLAGADAAPGSPEVGKHEVAVVQADFDELYEKMQAAHFDLYARRSKSEFDARFQSMRQSIREPADQFEIQVLFQKFLAYGRIAHARIDFPRQEFAAYRAAGGKVFPLYLRVEDDGVYIADNLSGLDTISSDDQVLALNGQPIMAVLERLAAHVSADNPYLANTQLEARLPAYVWLEMGSVESFDVSIAQSGKTRQITVPALARTAMQAAAARKAPAANEDLNQRAARIADGGIAYLRPGPFYNNEADATDPYDTSVFSTFLDAVFTRFIQADCESLVIDLRDNPGGDNSFSDLMVSWFADKPYRFLSRFEVKASQAAIDSNQKRIDPAKPNSISQQFAAAYQQRKLGEVFDFDIPMAYPRQGPRFSGKVYLLINRRTYSNGVMVAALAQDYGFATVVGEETADLASTYGAMEQFALSRTGIIVSFPKARLVRPNGNTEARGVVPDIVIRTPLSEGAQESVLAQALAIAAERK